MSALHKVRLDGQGQPPLLLILRLAILLLPTMPCWRIAAEPRRQQFAAVGGHGSASRRLRVGVPWPPQSAATARIGGDCLLLIALGWLWCGNAADDWYGNLVKAMLLVHPRRLCHSDTPELRRRDSPGSACRYRPAARNGPLSCRRAVRCRRSRPLLPLALTPRRRLLLQHPRA